jgi:hypothetical protein
MLAAYGIPGLVRICGQRGTTGMNGIPGMNGTTGMTGILGAIQILGMNGILGTREDHSGRTVLRGGCRSIFHCHWFLSSLSAS